ncbi:hypothetical protein LRS74_20145 [Streptomyces sp. LX-29]|uniref:hypothetical protein n=1 Tax=unclassified Streptomyces TaxID=2593676 RepID=UPI001184AAE1|nr:MULTISPECIES: hypothetical protein [unclassified Streptomyces]TVL88149.1 hypothetical protein CD790_31420 [Streptomyces sp. SAJ15]WFB09092.1 hypothetical protein LRS74_20145 [Streptomyces sp. LX-29]
MFGFSNAGLNVLVLRDGEELDATLRQALATADDAERPGLERAVALIAEQRALSDAELRVRWVRRALAGSGVDDHTDQVTAVRALRKAEPQLGLSTAVLLVGEAYGRSD